MEERTISIEQGHPADNAKLRVEAIRKRILRQEIKSLGPVVEEHAKSHINEIEWALINAIHPEVAGKEQEIEGIVLLWRENKEVSKIESDAMEMYRDMLKPFSDKQKVQRLELAKERASAGEGSVQDRIEEFTEIFGEANRDLVLHFLGKYAFEPEIYRKLISDLELLVTLLDAYITKEYIKTLGKNYGIYTERINDRLRKTLNNTHRKIFNIVMDAIYPGYVEYGFKGDTEDIANYPHILSMSYPERLVREHTEDYNFSQLNTVLNIITIETIKEHIKHNEDTNKPGVLYNIAVLAAKEIFEREPIESAIGITDLVTDVIKEIENPNEVEVHKVLDLLAVAALSKKAEINLDKNSMIDFIKGKKELKDFLKEHEINPKIFTIYAVSFGRLKHPSGQVLWLVDNYIKNRMLYDMGRISITEFKKNMASIVPKNMGEIKDMFLDLNKEKIGNLDFLMTIISMFNIDPSTNKYVITLANAIRGRKVEEAHIDTSLAIDVMDNIMYGTIGGMLDENIDNTLIPAMLDSVYAHENEGITVMNVASFVIISWIYDTLFSNETSAEEKIQKIVNTEIENRLKSIPLERVRNARGINMMLNAIRILDSLGRNEVISRIGETRGKELHKVIMDLSQEVSNVALEKIRHDIEPIEDIIKNDEEKYIATISELIDKNKIPLWMGEESFIALINSRKHEVGAGMRIIFSHIIDEYLSKRLKEARKR